MKTTLRIDQDRSIAEYVLGLSPSSDMAQIQDILSRHDPAAACALKWEAYLLGICDSMVPIAPPPTLFGRIQDALGHQTPVMTPPRHIEPVPAPAPIPRPISTPAAPASAPVQTSRRTESEHQPGPWRTIAILLGITVITLGFFLVKAWSRPDIPAIQIVQVAPTQAAILQAPGQSSTPGWLVTVDSYGTVRLDPQVKTSLQPDEAVQLWTRTAEGQDNRSLGLLDPNQAVTIPAKLIGVVVPGQIFEMTLEGQQGSTSGKPEGPILFIGQIVTFGAQSSNKPLA